MGCVNDVLRIAQGEIGYNRYNDPETGTKYGRWYAQQVNNSYFGQNGVPYCAMFASWVLTQAGVSCAGFIGAYCPTMYNAAKAAGRVRTNKQDAQPGDIVYFDWNGGVVDHVGIVEKNFGGYLQTIEGNTSSANNANGGQVARRTRNWGCITAVVTPYYDGQTSAPIPAPPAGNVGVYPKKGWTGSEVKKIQQALINKGYSVGKSGVDGDFGTDTDAAVRKFQRDNGLGVDGIVGPQTSAKLYASTPTSGGKLAVDGIWGSGTMKAIQRYFGTPVDGYASGQSSKEIKRINKGGLDKSAYRIGRGGSAVIKKIQQKVGTTADGYLGPNTIKAMQRYFGTPVDGYLSKNSNMVRAMQQRLNAGTF